METTYCWKDIAIAKAYEVIAVLDSRENCIDVAEVKQCIKRLNSYIAQVIALAEWQSTQTQAHSLGRVRFLIYLCDKSVLGGKYRVESCVFKIIDAIKACD